MVECREEDGIALIFFGVRIDIRSIVRVIMMGSGLGLGMGF